MIKGKWAGGKKKDEVISPVKKASVLAWLKEPKSMDRSNEAQQLKAKLLSVWPDLAYIYAAATAVSNHTHKNSSIAD